MLEMVADLSRRGEVGPGTKIVLISDLVNNSDSARFCVVKGALPPFWRFAQGDTYKTRLAPNSLRGVAVDILMLQRRNYGPYCSEDELRRWWKDYFQANGVKTPRVIRLRFGKEG